MLPPLTSLLCRSRLRLIWKREWRRSEFITLNKVRLPLGPQVPAKEMRKHTATRQKYFQRPCWVCGKDFVIGAAGEYHCRNGRRKSSPEQRQVSGHTRMGCRESSGQYCTHSIPNSSPAISSTQHPHNPPPRRTRCRPSGNDKRGGLHRPLNQDSVPAPKVTWLVRPFNSSPQWVAANQRSAWQLLGKFGKKLLYGAGTGQLCKGPHYVHNPKRTANGPPGKYSLLEWSGRNPPRRNPLQRKKVRQEWHWVTI